MQYTKSMKKEEFIARYGQAKYDERIARATEASRLRRSTPEGKAAWAAYMKQRYAKQHGGEVRPLQNRGLTGVKDGSYWKKWGQLPDVKEAARKRASAAYQALSPEERKAIQVKRYAARKAKRAANAAFDAAHLAAEQKRGAKWRAAHHEEHLERNRAYEKANPHVKRANKLARRVGGPLNPEYVKFLRSQPCLDCGATDLKITIGHLIPVVNGGTNHSCNLVAQCQPCNSKQHKRIHPRAMMAHYPQAAGFSA